jgi:hypothetical protein
MIPLYSNSAPDIFGVSEELFKRTMDSFMFREVLWSRGNTMFRVNRSGAKKQACLAWIRASE